MAASSGGLLGIGDAVAVLVILVVSCLYAAAPYQNRIVCALALQQQGEGLPLHAPILRLRDRKISPISVPPPDPLHLLKDEATPKSVLAPSLCLPVHLNLIP